MCQLFLYTLFPLLNARASIFSAAYLPGVYWRPALIRGRRLFSHVQISRVLVLHLTHIALVHMASLGSDFYKRLHGHQTGRPRRQVHTTCTGVLKISLAGANNLVPTTSLTPCIIIIHVYTCNYSGAGKNIDAR